MPPTGHLTDPMSNDLSHSTGRRQDPEITMSLTPVHGRSGILEEEGATIDQAWAKILAKDYDNGKRVGSPFSRSSPSTSPNDQNQWR